MVWEGLISPSLGAYKGASQLLTASMSSTGKHQHVPQLKTVQHRKLWPVHWSLWTDIETMHFYSCFLFLNIKTGKVGSKYNLSCCLGVTEFLQLLCASLQHQLLPLLQVGSSMRYRASPVPPVLAACSNLCPLTEVGNASQGSNQEQTSEGCTVFIFGVYSESTEPAAL